MCESNHYITGSADEENEDRESTRTIQSLQATWNFVKPSTEEDEIKERWFCIVRIWNQTEPTRRKSVKAISG